MKMMTLGMQISEAEYLHAEDSYEEYARNVGYALAKGYTTIDAKEEDGLRHCSLSKDFYMPEVGDAIGFVFDDNDGENWGKLVKWEDWFNITLDLGFDNQQYVVSMKDITTIKDQHTGKAIVLSPSTGIHPILAIKPELDMGRGL